MPGRWLSVMSCDDDILISPFASLFGFIAKSQNHKETTHCKWLFVGGLILLMEVVYPIIYKVVYIPGGAGFLPSTVYVQNLSKSFKKLLTIQHLNFACSFVPPKAGVRVVTLVAASLYAAASAFSILTIAQNRGHAVSWSIRCCCNVGDPWLRNNFPFGL